MKKVKISKKIAEEAKDREKRWKELRGFLEKYEDPKRKANFEKDPPIDPPQKKSEESEIDQILKSLGLEKYAKAMKDNGVDDLEILQELTEEHLEQIGMVLGHRIKLMKKIKELKGKETNNAISTEISNAIKSSPVHFTRNAMPMPEVINPKSNIISRTSRTPQENLTTKGVSIEIQADASDLNKIEIKEKPDHFKQITAEIAGINSKSRVKAEEPVPIIMSKPPVASKQATVGKTINTFQPHSVEAEKVVKLSEIVKESPEEVKAQDQIKWDQFSYVPYKPSEEIQAAKVNKPASRPHSATNRIDQKPVKVETPKEKFDMAGWES